MSDFCCYPTAAIDVIDFQKIKFVAPAISTQLPSESLYCSLPYLLVLLTPLAPFFFWIVIAALFTAFTIGEHIVPHIFAVLLATLFAGSITLLALC